MLSKDFTVLVNGLVKSFRYKTYDVKTEYGYTDLLCEFEAKSSILVDGEVNTIKVEADVIDGVCVYITVNKTIALHTGESLMNCMYSKSKTPSRVMDSIVEDINRSIEMYAGERDFSFVESVISLVLSINSFDTNTNLYNDVAYSILDVA